MFYYFDLVKVTVADGPSVSFPLSELPKSYRFVILGGINN